LFKSYEHYHKNQNGRAEAVLFMQNLVVFKAHFDAAKDFYRNIIKMLSTSAEFGPKTDGSTIEVHLLGIKINFENFISRLGNIQDIYTEVGDQYIKGVNLSR